MTHAYNELYVSNAQSVLGSMLDHAVYDMKWDLEDFYKAFINSGIAFRFGIGEPKYTVGMSGIELAREVLWRVTGERIDPEPGYRMEKTPEYWTGWALAYYEWCRNIPFDAIAKSITVAEIRAMYHPYHEADITKFVIYMDRMIEERKTESMLARLRAYSGMTQKALAERSGVSVRMIEQYEQGKKDIGKASATTVYSLARVLHCRVEDLI